VKVPVGPKWSADPRRDPETTVASLAEKTAAGPLDLRKPKDAAKLARQLEALPDEDYRAMLAVKPRRVSSCPVVQPSQRGRRAASGGG
jgi:hypothetical protein